MLLSSYGPKNRQKQTGTLRFNRTWPLHLMMLPPVIMLLIFAYVPMVGIVIAFQDFIPTRGFFGSEWIGWENFEYLFMLPDFGQIVWNTLTIAVEKIVTAIGCGLLFSLLISEINNRLINKVSQSLILFPWFISWVILGNVFQDVLSLDGAANSVIKALGGNSVFFMGDNGWFRFVLIFTNMWKDMGYNMVIFLTAIAGIDPGLYEAATIDGAGKFRQAISITLPSINPTIILLVTLALGGVLNAGFDQIYVLYNNAVIDTSEIIDTYIYKLGFYDAQYALSTAAGLFKSVVGCVCLSLSYYLANRLANYRIF